MGKAMEIISGQVVAPSTGFTALTVNAGNSLTIRNAAPDSEILLAAIWGKHQTAGNIRVRSPQLHDNVQGIRLYDIAANPAPLFPMGSKQTLNAQDTLIVEVTGSATAGDVEIASLLVWYESLPGIEGRFMTEEEMNARAVDILAVENTLASGTAGGWSGQEAINAEFDLFKANTDYALVGYQCGVLCGSIRWQGSDVGNLGVGGPGNINDKHFTGRWFAELSKFYNRGMIPIFNSANKNAILIDCHQDEVGADPIVTSLFVELAP
jgi:hypothetical protein